MASEVHNVRFYNLSTASVKCMSCDEDCKLLGVARIDNTIEVWNISHSPHIERTITGIFDEIQGIAWFKRRLFSVGIQGSVIEYDLFNQTPKSMHPVTSGSCWCIAVKPEKSQLAAGSEAGYVNIFDIESNEIVYKTLLNKQEGRVQCLAWNKEGSHIVTGSTDTIRIFDVETGHAIHRMMTGRVHADMETTVYSLAVTDDFTIIGGDSRGKLSLWDGKSGINITSYQTHKSAVLAVCLQGNTVFCTGTDSPIATFERVKVREGHEKWVKSIQRHIHDHEVNSLVVCDNQLFSAGLDGYIALSSYPPKKLMKYPPLLQNPAVHLSEKRWILLRYHYSLELYELGIKDTKSPDKLLVWKPPSNLRIRCAALSPDGNWMACSAQGSFWLYFINMDDGKLNIKKFKVATEHDLSSHTMCFNSDSSRLVLGTVDGNLILVSVHNKKPKVINCFSEKEFKDCIKMVVASGEFIVASDLQNNIIVWKNDEVFAKLPKYSCSITAMAINPSTNNLVLAYADRKIMEYSLNKGKFTKFSKSLQQQYPKQWLSRNFAVQNITFDVRNDKIIILHDDSMILIINKNKELPEVEAKIPRLDSEINEDTLDNSNQHPFSKTTTNAFHVIRKYKHLVHFGELCDGEMVAVEVSPSSLIKQIPLSMSESRFGRK